MVNSIEKLLWLKLSPLICDWVSPIHVCIFPITVRKDEFLRLLPPKTSNFTRHYKVDSIDIPWMTLFSHAGLICDPHFFFFFLPERGPYRSHISGHKLQSSRVVQIDYPAPEEQSLKCQYLIQEQQQMGLISNWYTQIRLQFLFLWNRSWNFTPRSHIETFLCSFGNSILPRRPFLQLRDFIYLRIALGADNWKALGHP